jgi:hypothetical protein
MREASADASSCQYLDLDAVDLTKLEWFKSPASNSGSCVEVARLGSIILLRETENAEEKVIPIPPHSWRAFVTGIVRGDFDRLLSD